MARTRNRARVLIGAHSIREPGLKTRPTGCCDAQRRHAPGTKTTKITKITNQFVVFVFFVAFVTERDAVGRPTNWLSLLRRLARRLEQLRRELREVVAPVQPRVPAFALEEHRREAVFLEEVHRVRRRRDQPVFLAGAEPEEAQAAPGGGVVERREVRFLPRLAEGRRRRRGRRRARGGAAAATAEDPRAE